MYQRNTALCSEVHVRLVDYNDVIRVAFNNAPDIRKRQDNSRGCIGIGNEYCFVLTYVIVGVYRKVICKRHFGVGNTAKLCKYRVKAVGNVGKHRRGAFVAERHEGKVQNFVRAVGKDKLVGRNAEILCRLSAKLPALRVGVKLKLLCRP